MLNNFHKNYKILILLSLFSILTACSNYDTLQDGAPGGHINVSRIPNPIPRPLPLSKYGNPPHYVVHGKKYHVLKSARGYHARGYASWYGTKFHKRLTSSREPYDLYAMTAASPVLPIPSFVQVTNLENGRQVIVKVNDRGPFKSGRIMDLSYVAATKLGVVGRGTALVDVRSIDDYSNNFFTPISPAPVNNIKESLFLQVAALSNSNKAETLRSKLQEQFHQNTLVDKSRSAKKVVYKVLIGPLNSTEASHTIRAKLKEQGYKKALEIVK
jgi:rare lipoprotein A